jgi:elongation factor P
MKRLLINLRALIASLGAWCCMKANELKKGAVFQLDGRNIVVRQMQVQAPSSRSGSTLYKVRGQDVANGQKFEKNFKGDEVLTPVDIARRPVQFLYRDADGCTFMDSESYEQYTLGEQAIEDDLPFISEGIEGVTALVSDGVLLGIELPATVALEIVDTAPGMKAASSSARTKPATLTTGLVVQVPEYLTPGEKIKINTETREFMSRA